MRIESWADSSVFFKTQHIMWIYGYVGCGKSSLAQTVAERYARKGRLAASFFFFRGSDARSRTLRFAATVASQLGAAIPAIVSHLEKAVKAHPGILTTFSLGAQFEHLVYEPLKKVTKRNVLSGSLFRTPYLITVDGLDECNDREEVAAFIEHMLEFFKENPRFPLRFLFTSRVEEHIRTRLDSDQVHLLNLIDHTSLDDVAAVTDATFAMAAKHDRVIQTYGQWPSVEDRRKLVEHSGGSLIFMSTILKFIIGPSDDGLTPMERLPLALDISPGLDGLYSHTLSRSEGLPYFLEIITALVLFVRSPSILQLAEALGIEPFEVVRVLVNLHSILHVPGDDRTPVTICHISLRDFLQSERRARRFFISPTCHDRVYTRVFAGCGKESLEVVAAIALARQPLSINELAALLDFETSGIILALDSIMMDLLFCLPNGFDDPIIPCNVSLPGFLRKESRSGSVYISPLYEEALAYACFTAIAYPLDHEAAVNYAKLHALGHWYAFLESLPRNAAYLKDQVNTTLSRLRQTFSYRPIDIVDVVLTIIFTLSGAPLGLPLTESVNRLLQAYPLPGEPEHAILIAQVLVSFTHHASLGSLADIQPGIVDHLSQRALWDPTYLQHRVIVRAHIGLLLIQDDLHDAVAYLRDQETGFHFGEILEVRSEASPLFISEFTRFIMNTKVKEVRDRHSVPVTVGSIIGSALATDAPLDELYSQILGHADRSVPFLGRFLSTTALLEEPFTLDQLSRFLKIRRRKIRSLLERLRGIIRLPPTDYDKIKLPPPFRDFLRDGSRSGRFVANASSGELAVKCLELWVNDRVGDPGRSKFLYDYACTHFNTHWKASLVGLPLDNKTRSKQLASAIKLLGRHFSFNVVHILLQAYLEMGHGLFHEVAKGHVSERLPNTYDSQQSWVLESHLVIAAKVLDILDQHFHSLGPLITPDDLVGGPIAKALYAYTKRPSAAASSSRVTDPNSPNTASPDSPPTSAAPASSSERPVSYSVPGLEVKVPSLLLGSPSSALSEPSPSTTGPTAAGRFTIPAALASPANTAFSPTPKVIDHVDAAPPPPLLEDSTPWTLSRIASGRASKESDTER